ncbi:MAG: hypothetical protein QM736_20035 [Vicinamibacterales bacterium]
MTGTRGSTRRDRCEETEVVAVGQLRIEQNGVRFGRGVEDDDERGMRVGRFDNLEPVRAKSLGNGPAYQRLVIHDQDAGRGFLPHLGEFPAGCGNGRRRH